MANDTLLAIPFFTFMGLILERSGMAEDLLDTIGQLFGPIRGGVAYAVIFVGALLAATTGVVAASVISMGLISLPVMLRYGYDKRLASGVIAASGTLAQIIPPSLVLIVMADQLGRSVGDMYKAAFVPGLLLTAMYAGYVLALSIFKPHAVPALPPEARNLREPNGDSGVRLAAGAGRRRGRRVSYAFASWYGAQPSQRWPADEVGIYCGRGRHRRCASCSPLTQPPAQARPAVAHGRKSGVRADPAAGADLPGAGHDLHRHRHADRRRRHGRAGRPDPGDAEPPAVVEPAEAGHEFDHPPVLLRRSSS